MRFSRFGITLLFAIAVLATPSPAAACSCMVVGPACQAYWKTDAVFDATVTRIQRLPRVETTALEYPSDDTLVTLQVHRSWKGTGTGEIEITTASSSSACGYEFKEGDRYLVFARHWRGRLTVSYCSATQRFDGSGPAAEFLASLERPATGGRLFGTVRTSHRVFEHERSLPETDTVATVRLNGSGRSWTTKSTGGRYEFRGLPEGTYEVEVEAPEGYTTWARTRTVDIPSGHACAEENFGFAPAGRIAGRLVDPDGRGLADVRVEITVPDAMPHPIYGLPMESRSTDASGFFELGGLPPGRYVLGVNLRDLPNKYNPYGRTVYPGTGEPHVIELALGQVVDLGTWFMPPPLPITRVEGIVMRADGTPVSGVHVGAWDDTGNPVERARGAGNTSSDADGRFVLELRQGRIYNFTARDKQAKPMKVRAPRLETRDLARTAIQIVLLDDGSK